MDFLKKVGVFFLQFVFVVGLKFEIMEKNPRNIVQNLLILGSKNASVKTNIVLGLSVFRFSIIGIILS